MRLKRSALAAVLAVPTSHRPGAAQHAASSAAETTSSATTAVAAAAPDDRPRDVIAIEWVQAHAADYGVTAADVANLVVNSMYTSKHNKITHVNLRQRRAAGVGASTGVVATVNIREDGSVLFVGENLAANINPAAGGTLDSYGGRRRRPPPRTSSDSRRRRTCGPSTGSSGAERGTLLTDGGISEEPIPANLTYAQTDDGLRLAWEVVIDDADDVAPLAGRWSTPRPASCSRRTT